MSSLGNKMGRSDSYSSDENQPMAAKRIRQTNSSSSSSSSSETSTALLLPVLRNSGGIMSNIHSFLPLVPDRIRLGQVDKAFLNDGHRGRIVTVYGDDDLNIEQAMERIQEYLDFEGTPQSMLEEERATWNRLEDDDCWCWDVAWDPTLFSSNHTKLFNEKEGWDIDAISKSGLVNEKKMDGILDGFRGVNLLRQKQHENFCTLKVKVKELGPNPPYNALFDIMKDLGMNHERFLIAIQPAVRQLVNNGADEVAESIYEICNMENAENSSRRFLKHLRPARKFLFWNADGKLAEKVLKKCDKCGFIKENVLDEHCPHGWCKTIRNLCLDCTAIITCGACGARGCDEDRKHPGLNLIWCKYFFVCCVCGIYLCNCTDYDPEYFRSVPESAGCFFVDINEDEIDLEVRSKYCEKHKPQGARQRLGFPEPEMYP